MQQAMAPIFSAVVPPQTGQPIAFRNLLAMFQSYQSQVLNSGSIYLCSFMMIGVGTTGTTVSSGPSAASKLWPLWIFVAILAGLIIGIFALFMWFVVRGQRKVRITLQFVPIASFRWW